MPYSSSGRVSGHPQRYSDGFPSKDTSCLTGIELCTQALTTTYLDTNLTK